MWQALRHQVFLGSDAFVERLAGQAEAVEREPLREVPRAQRRALARPLAHFEKTCPDHRDAMARAFLTGAYTMQEIAAHFGVHYSTVGRAVRHFEARGGGGSEKDRPGNLMRDCKTLLPLDPAPAAPACDPAPA